MARKSPEPRHFKCADCGRDALRPGGAKYCHVCSAERDLKRKRVWSAEKATYDPKKTKKSREARTIARRAEGAQRSERLGIGWVDDCEPDLAWMVRVAVPFSQDLSKNAIWRNVRAGHTYLRKEAKQARASVADHVRLAMRGCELKHNKLWVDIGVEKPHHRTDAANFVDSIFDAIQDATELDDRWYSLRRLDWRVVKIDPKIYIGIGQEAVEDGLVCSYCGRILPLDRFGKNRANPMGRSRTCKECSRASDAIRRKKRKAV